MELLLYCVPSRTGLQKAAAAQTKLLCNRQVWRTSVNHNFLGIGGTTCVILKVLNDDGDKFCSFAIAGGDGGTDRVNNFVIRPDGVYRDGQRHREWYAVHCDRGTDKSTWYDLVLSGT